MTADAVAYQCTNPALLDEWDEAERLHRERNDRVREFQAEFPGFLLTVRRGVYGGQDLVGLRAAEDNNEDSPGDGWRWSNHWRITSWVPDKRTKAGKGYAERIRALSGHAVAKFTGMPLSCFHKNHHYCPGIYRHADALVASWGGDLHDVLVSDGLDLTLWGPLRLSEFYAIEEERAS